MSSSGLCCQWQVTSLPVQCCHYQTAVGVVALAISWRDGDSSKGPSFIMHAALGVERVRILVIRVTRVESELKWVMGDLILLLSVTIALYINIQIKFHLANDKKVEEKSSSFSSYAKFIDSTQVLRVESVQSSHFFESSHNSFHPYIAVHAHCRLLSSFQRPSSCRQPPVW